MARATVFNANPASQAKEFEEQGFSWLHLVDLDGAFSISMVLLRASPSMRSRSLRF